MVYCSPNILEGLFLAVWRVNPSCYVYICRCKDTYIISHELARPQSLPPRLSNGYSVLVLSRLTTSTVIHPTQGALPRGRSDSSGWKADPRHWAACSAPGCYYLFNQSRSPEHSFGEQSTRSTAGNVALAAV